MVMIELVYCKITGKQRAMPKIHHFIPLVPWSCKKIKGKQKVMERFDKANEGATTKLQKKEQFLNKSIKKISKGLDPSHHWSFTMYMSNLILMCLLKST